MMNISRILTSTKLKMTTKNLKSKQKLKKIKVQRNLQFLLRRRRNNNRIKKKKNSSPNSIYD